MATQSGNTTEVINVTLSGNTNNIHSSFQCDGGKTKRLFSKFSKTIKDMIKPGKKCIINPIANSPPQKCLAGK
jgi:hypothetical protein